VHENINFVRNILIMNRKRFLIFFFSVLCGLSGQSINLPEVLTNSIFTDNIRTVQLCGDDGSLSNPVIFLKSEQILHFSFDDLSNEVKNYYYTIYHCDRNWKLSKISQEEYLESFTDFPLNDYAFSKNTKVRYINYSLILPNKEVPIKYSGNYILVIFDKDNPDEPLIIQRFFVVEPTVKIDARIKRGTFDQSSRSGELQEIDFQIHHENLPVKNPHTDIKVTITQNNRTDNLLTGLDPIFSDDKILEYDYNLENNFSGDNEYRSFEIRGINFPGKNVADISFNPPFYHMTLEPDKLRTQNQYFYDRDINGLYRIEMYKSDYPEIEADYIFVHFTLKMDQVLSGGGVYVFGALTNWQCNKLNEMKWNMDEKQYELTLLLKQGYYNYCYAWRDFTNNKIKLNALEGSHYETENDYFIYVYYGKISDRYDRLVGYQKFNSLKDRSTLNNFD
jgi:hypothetical protein